VSALNGKVISALKKCLEPALENCSISWGSEIRELNTVFRNQLVYETNLMTKSAFEGNTVSLYCKKDPTTGNPVELTFSPRNFAKVSEDESMGMFQMCAMRLPKLTTEQSIKYQVLSETTAMVGVVK